MINILETINFISYNEECKTWNINFKNSKSKNNNTKIKN